MTTRNPNDDLNKIPLHRSKVARSKAIKFKEHGYTLTGIAKELAAIGYCNKNGEPYHKSTIHGLINGGRK